MKTRGIAILLAMVLLLAILSGVMPNVTAAPGGFVPLSLSETDAAAVAAAAETLRAGLIRRETVIEISLHVDAVDQTLPREILSQIYDAAIAHTGVPKEGDYLRCRLRGVQMDISETVNENGMDLIATFQCEYSTDAAQETGLDAAITGLLTALELWNGTDYEKIRGIYDYICQNIAIDHSLLFYRMALELGVDCRVITGDANGTSHMWNIVALEGQYYCLDSVWDAGSDPYAWFLLGSEAFLQTHTPDAMYADPAFQSSHPISATDYTLQPEHQYEAVVTAPTCTEAGCTTYTCSICGDSYVDEITPAMGHSWDEGVVTREPTETETGEMLFACAVCGETRVETIPVTEHVHDYVSTVTAPTCTEAGYTTYTCTCGSYVDDHVAALGHVYDSQVTVPTCTEDGYTTYTCSRCGEGYVGDTVPAKGHGWDEGIVTKEPTEHSAGQRLHTCLNCGQTKTESIPELSHVHQYQTVVTAPTCTEEGYTTYTCTCGSYVDDYVAALGHGYRDSVCIRCGKKAPAQPPTVDPTQPGIPAETDPTQPNSGRQGGGKMLPALAVGALAMAAVVTVMILRMKKDKEKI